MGLPLPPLPRLPGDACWEPAGAGVVDVLTAEHRRLGALCARLDSARPPDRRREIADVLVAALARHLSAEEQYVYPSLRAALPDGDGLAERETARDRALLLALADLSGAAPTAFDRSVAAVRWLVARHCAAVDRVLPRLRAEVSDADLVRLGNRVAVAQEAAPTRPHPGAPATPPWNRVVDPALGLVDRVRDAVTGRSTYPRDL